MKKFFGVFQSPSSGNLDKREGSFLIVPEISNLVAVHCVPGVQRRNHRSGHSMIGGRFLLLMRARANNQTCLEESRAESRKVDWPWPRLCLQGKEGLGGECERKVRIAGCTMGRGSLELGRPGV